VRGRERARAREARAESDALAATPSGSSLACVHADVEERAERVKASQREMLEAEHALRMARIDSHDVHAAGERLRTVRQSMQGVQHALEESRARAWQLIEGPCPELLVDMPESCKPLSNLTPELRVVLVPGRALSHYEPIEWPSERLEPGHSRHVVRPYLFAGQAVVLKEYAMASAQHRRMLEREVAAIMRLAHPHIVRLQAVFVDEDGYSHCLKAYVQTQLCTRARRACARRRARHSCARHQPARVCDGCARARSANARARSEAASDSAGTLALEWDRAWRCEARERARRGERGVLRR